MRGLDEEVGDVATPATAPAFPLRLRITTRGAREVLLDVAAAAGVASGSDRVDDLVEQLCTRGHGKQRGDHEDEATQVVHHFLASRVASNST
jgi:hypothetical protein